MITKNYRIPFILITSLFFMWGLANNMTDTLLAAFKKIMDMSDSQTAWVQMSFYGAYFFLAVPAAITIRKTSYKTGVLIGLGMFILGALLFYPASKTMVYGHFLTALFILAGGLSFLETSANPYIIKLGPEQSAVQRLNVAQSFNPIGSITGAAMGKFLILANLNQATKEDRALLSAQQLSEIQEVELSAMMGPYVGIAFLLIFIWLAIYLVKMPSGSEDQNDSMIRILQRILKNRNYLIGVVAQFFYVGAQIGVWSFTIRYVMEELSIQEDEAATYYIISLILFMIARFVCSWLMNFIKPGLLLTICAIGGAICCLLAYLFGGNIGVYALVSTSIFMSLMFPTIFGLSTRGMGDDIKIAGSGMIMAIVGGAVITKLQAIISDFGGIHLAYLVPFGCFTIIGCYSYFVKHDAS